MYSYVYAFFVGYLQRLNISRHFAGSIKKYTTHIHTQAELSAQQVFVAIWRVVFVFSTAVKLAQHFG